jgi:hypothetical protein
MASKTFIVAVYLEDRHYGGPEEGGWWYNAGDLVRVIRVFKSECRASLYACRLNRMLDATLNKGRPSTGSMLSQGRYVVDVCEDNAPAHYPETRPHYE